MSGLFALARSRRIKASHRRRRRCAVGQIIFRDYEPGTGRYVESDPIGLLAGPSTYSYSLNSPLIYIDSLGLDVDFDLSMCLYEQARRGTPGTGNCGSKFLQSAIAGLKKESVRECKVIGESVVCTAVCSARNFIFDPREPLQSIFEKHVDVIIDAVKKAATDIAAKNLARAAGMAGALMTFKDTVGTIQCTTECVKK